MSLRLEMLQVARLAPKLLGESTPLVQGFLAAQCRPDGGFAGRSGASDLYYTVFGLDGLMALRTEPLGDRTAPYLRGFGHGEGLDLVHLCCLARCWAAVGGPVEAELSRGILERLERCRTPDGGYAQEPGAAHGTVYGSFLALGAYQDLQRGLRQADRLSEVLARLATGDGAWTNHYPAHRQGGSTLATAAAVTLQRHLGLPTEAATVAWLLARHHPQGGFRATPDAPMPDLLSTATALHALAGLETSLEAIREPCLDFLDSLWDNAGGFHGHWADDTLDCEYTFYGLLALGHLSL